MVAKRKTKIAGGFCEFTLWKLPSGKLHFEANLEDLKGITKPVKKQTRKPKN